jgi:hypothetical protein
MRLNASAIAIVLVLAACANKKPAEEPENSDETESSNDTPKESSKESSKEPTADEGDPSQLGTSNLGRNGVGAPAQKATIQDDTEEKQAIPCSGMNIPNLLAALSQAACELPEGTAPSPQRATKSSLDVAVSTDSAKVAPGGAAKIFLVFKNKGKTKLPLDFTVDPDPRFTFELYTPKGARAADKPVGKEPSLPAATADNPGGEPRLARVTLDPNGMAKLALDWQAVRYKWAAKEKAKGALAGHGFPREPAGPLPRGKYVLHIVMPLANGDDPEIRQPRLSIEVSGTPEVAPLPEAAPKPAPAASAPAAAAPPSDSQVEAKFLKTVGGASSAAPAASSRPPAKKH